MNWEQMITTLRFGMETSQNKGAHDSRNEFQRDYDRLIFSAPFRRMQNKTQVFPLPGSVFVHNRLTHSLEVSSVGRSLGHLVATALTERHPHLKDQLSNIDAIVSAACLAHDMGNPPFGHSGERAINTFFTEGEGQKVQTLFTQEQWADFAHFEGNPNTFRQLTHQFLGRRAGGFVLTYPTIASIVKYPYSALSSPNKKGKFGFFQSDKQAWEQIAHTLGIEHIKKTMDNGEVVEMHDMYHRYPLVYLVEAADDICYEIMDIEDAHKLRILTTAETHELLLCFFNEERRQEIVRNMERVQDKNEQIVYLRSCVIGCLIDACARCFIDNEEAILQGSFRGSLIKNIAPEIRYAYEQCSDIAVKQIYRSHEVLDIELAGYKIIYMLMEELTKAAFQPDKAYSKQLLERIPEQYDIYAADPYTRVQGVIDYVSGMTDVYALDLYRKITGIDIPRL